MSTEQVEARTADVLALAQVLGRTASLAQAAVDSTSADLRRAQGQLRERLATARRRHQRAGQDLAAATAALDACPENCGPLVAAVERCQSIEQDEAAHVDRLSNALAVLDRAAVEFDASRRAASLWIQDSVPAAVSNLKRFADGLDGYLRTRLSDVRHAGGAGGSRGGGGAIGGGASVTTVLPGGVEMVALSAVDWDVDGDLPESVRVSASDMSWGIEKLEAVVLPAIEAGKDVGYFRARDAAEGLSGTRSYESVYEAFFNADFAVKLTALPSGRFEIINGYHRVALARRLGVSKLPTIVRR